MKNKLILSLILFCSIGLTACGQTGPQGPAGPVGPQGPVGETGETGQPGKDGVGIISINKTGTKDNVDTYTITYSDGTSSIFVIVNGENGEQGIQGVPGKDGQTPTISISDDGYWVIDGVKTQTKAQGEKGNAGSDGKDGAPGADGQDGQPGKDGDNGLSAYEIYKKYHPEYTGTEEDWINEIAGNIKSDCAITFITNTEDIIESQTIKSGSKITKPKNLYKDGYDFLGWMYNDEFWNFSGCVVTSDMTLTACWADERCDYVIQNNTVNLKKFNADKLKYGLLDLGELFKGIELVKIGRNAFKDQKIESTDLVIPSTVKYIGDFAFYNNYFTSIKFPDELMYLGEQAFYGNYFTELNLPKNIDILREKCFVYNHFETINIPRNIKTIEMQCFSSCQQLKAVYIPKEVENIEWLAFSSLAPNATVYCERVSQPSGYVKDWCTNAQIVWGATMPY